MGSCTTYIKQTGCTHGYPDIGVRIFFQSGPATCLFSGPQNPGTDMPNYIHQHRFSGFLIYGDRYFVYGQIYHSLSSELHCRYRFSGSWERDFSPWPDTPIAASCNILRISPTPLPSLSPYLIPAEFLTSTVCSRLGLPSLRMVPYHSTPPTPR